MYKDFYMIFRYNNHASFESIGVIFPSGTLVKFVVIVFGTSAFYCSNIYIRFPKRSLT